MTYAMTLPFERLGNTTPANADLQNRVQRFLFAEAQLIDERRFDEWTSMLADDLHYFAPTRYNRNPRERAKEWGAIGQAAHFEDSKDYMLLRVKRLHTDRSWSEDPPSRTRHLISNVVVNESQDGMIEAESNFYVFRGRADERDFFVGARYDHLRAADNPYGFELVKRVILFDDTTIHSNNLGIFF